jgi:hypothetical protein
MMGKKNQQLEINGLKTTFGDRWKMMGITAKYTFVLRMECIISF